jgi:sugar O-acyltransferase (sialic acid O-acetyltransferase NeuD family)
VVAFTVGRAYLSGEETAHGLPLVPFESLAETHPPDQVDLFVAIGYRRVNRGRASAYASAKASGYRLATYVSPRALVSPDTVIGDNCFIFEGVIIQPFVRIGNDTIIWSGACIAHDSTIGDHCFVAPMASISGNVELGDFCFVGNNATVRDGIVVADATVIGAGALIKRSTQPGEVYPQRRSAARLDLRSDELDSL